MEIDIAIDLVESKVINQTIQTITENQDSLDNIDIDKLHSNLIIIAELSSFIVQNIPLSSLKKIINIILPVTFKFQLLNNQNNVSLKGNQIKDATNFICWSLIRDRNLKKIVLNEKIGTDEVPLAQLLYDDIFLNLLMNSLFDKDFIIRKSSNAALQEFLGRIQDISQGSTLYTTINSVTIMKLIEIKFNDINVSYEKNLITLYEIFRCGSTYENDMPVTFFQKVMNWFINYNILTNFDLQIVKMSIESVKILLNTVTSIDSSSLIFYNIKELLKDDYITFQENPMKCARLLYLLTEIDPSSNEIPSSTKLKLYETVISSHYRIVKSNEDYFKFLSILKYWNVQTYVNDNFIINETIVNFIFNNIVSSNQTTNSSIWFDDISILLSKLLVYITSEPHPFNNANTEKDFFIKYQKYVTFNNELICSTLPIVPRDLFLSLFMKHKDIISCQCKAVMIRSMINNFMEIIYPNFIEPDIENYVSTPFIVMIGEFLSDHTITEQGDVGRLVRRETCLLLDKYLDKFPEFEKDNFGIKLLYLMAEPSNEISHLSLQILATKYVPSFKIDYLPNHHNLNILEMRDTFLADISTNASNDLKKERITFWKHFAIRGGAFRSTDEQLTSCIDNFIIWYEDKERIMEEKIAIFHELINSIPSAAVILNEKDKKEKSNIITTATLCINFITRLISSNIVFHTTNWEGILIKMHNLLILNGSNMLKITILKFLPFLWLAYSLSVQKQGDFVFANKIIDKLFNTVKKYHNQKDRDSITRTALQSLLQIYLENNNQDHIFNINALVESDFNENNMDISNFYIHA